MDILILNLFLGLIFDFGKWSNWKYTSKRIGVFSVLPLPEVKNLFRTQIWNENVYMTILIFFERFAQYFKKSKNVFPIVVSNLERKGSGVYFHARVLIFSPNALY